MKTRGSAWPRVSRLGDAAESDIGDEDIVCPARTIRTVGWPHARHKLAGQPLGARGARRTNLGSNVSKGQFVGSSLDAQAGSSSLEESGCGTTEGGCSSIVPMGYAGDWCQRINASFRFFASWSHDGVLDSRADNVGRPGVGIDEKQGRERGARRYELRCGSQGRGRVAAMQGVQRGWSM